MLACVCFGGLLGSALPAVTCACLYFCGLLGSCRSCSHFFRGLVLPFAFLYAFVAWLLQFPADSGGFARSCGLFCRFLLVCFFPALCGQAAFVIPACPCFRSSISSLALPVLCGLAGLPVSVFMARLSIFPAGLPIVSSLASLPFCLYLSFCACPFFFPQSF